MTVLEMVSLPLVTIKQAAAILQVTTQTIHNYIGRGELIPVKKGNTIRIRTQDLLA